MGPLLLDLEHVSVVRGDKFVLQDVSVKLRGGEHLAILGPNGCGKSTLLKTLTCELYPIPGPATTVNLFGRARWDVTALRRRLGVVSGEPPGEVMLRNTGSDAVLTGFFSSATLWPHLVASPSMRERAAILLARTGAEHLRDRIVGTMSAGEQRRIMIARALAGSTAHRYIASENCQRLATDHETSEVLLLDEPSNALDLAAQRALRDLLRSLAQHGTSIVLITHHVSDVIPEMQRILLMKEGAIFRDGPRDQVLTSPLLTRLFGVPIVLSESDGILTAS